LQIHLLAWQEAAVTQGPVGASQSSLHHPGSPTDRDKGHEGHNQMGSQQGKAMAKLEV
jgi:hypothetical protein